MHDTAGAADCDAEVLTDAKRANALYKDALKVVPPSLILPGSQGAVEERLDQGELTGRGKEGNTKKSKQGKKGKEKKRGKKKKTKQ